MSKRREPEDLEALSITDIRLRSLYRALRRTRAVLYVATMDGTIRNTLWANARESLLDYLDRVIVATLDEGDAGPVSAGSQIQAMPISELIVTQGQLPDSNPVRKK